MSLLVATTAPVESIYVNEAYVYETLSIGNVEGDTNYVFPSSRSGNSRLVCDDDGQLYWLDNGAVFTNISPENGIQVNIRTDDYGGSYGNIFNRTASIGAVLGNGLSFDSNGAIQVEFNDFTTCDITEGSGCGNLWYTDQRVFDFLEVAVAPPVDTGLQALSTPLGDGSGREDYELSIHGGAGRVIGTIQADADSPVSVQTFRTGTAGTTRDDFGFARTVLDVNLGPNYEGDGVTGLRPGPGIINNSGQISLDWLHVADNLYTGDTSRLPVTEPAPAGEIGITRVQGNPEDPTTHIIYLKSLSSVGGGDTSKLMFINKTNTMEGTSGKITFGTGTNALTLGVGSSSTPFNSAGRLRHFGSAWLYRVDSNNNGSLTCDGDVTAFRQTTSSDERLKKNITPISNGLDKVLKLQGVNYQFTHDRDNRREVGLIAQQVEEVVPEVIGEREDGMKTVNYGALVGVLIEAVKELTQEVETLKAKLGD